MPPPVEGKLAVTSICLEDVSVSSGPLVFYPATHKIPPYRFSHGGIHAVNEEMPACLAYVAEHVASKAQRKEFIGKQGYVFIWHGQLLHGGSKITDLQKTRKTLVTHYWRAQDVDKSYHVKVHDSGYYFRRDHAAAG
jgi:phytanoyl-CoA hydroxylase